MVKVVKKLSNNVNHYGKINTKKYITIHETANTGVGANADAHANFINNGAQETWHYTVDSEKAVQHFAHEFALWHAGNYTGNTVSIGIEMCVNRDGNYKKTLQNTIELVQSIMGQENISFSKVVQHNHWSGKNCPTLLRQGTHGMNWSQFKDAISGAKSKPKKVGIWNINQYGAYWRKKKGRFKVGGEQIETRIGAPTRKAPSGGHVKPKQEFNFDEVVIRDKHYWLGLTNNRGQREYVPITKVHGVPPKQKYNPIWGKYIK